MQNLTGQQSHKVKSGKYVAFERICFFLDEHTDSTKSMSHHFADVKWIDTDLHFDNETGLWYMYVYSGDEQHPKDIDVKAKHTYILLRDLSHLVTCTENG